MFGNYLAVHQCLTDVFGADRALEDALDGVTAKTDCLTGHVGFGRIVAALAVGAWNVDARELGRASWFTC